MNRHNFDSQATTPRPQLVCVCCGEPLHCYWQPSILASKPGHWLCECHNNPIDCLLHMQTFSAENYPPANLDAYLAYGEKVSNDRLALLPEEWRTA